MKRKLSAGALAALLLVLAAGPVYLSAQTSAGAAAPAAANPAPSRLRIATKGAEITLTWEDAVGFTGRYGVFRSASVITAESFSKATRLAEVASGVKRYVDRPADRQGYYYALLALDAKGEPYKSFSAGRTTTAAAVAAEPAPPPAGIKSLLAKAEKDSVILEFAAEEGAGRLLLYRGTAPFSDAASLLDAALVSSLEGKEGRFVDYPVPGIDYWYALLTEEELRAGRIAFKPGANASSKAARISEGLYRVGLPETPALSRTPPLPAFLLDRGIAAVGGTGLGRVMEPPRRAPPRRELAPETVKALGILLPSAPTRKPPMPATRALARDLAEASAGEEYALSLIVRQEILAGDDDGAIAQLRKYLSLNRSETVDARARFYLGSALARKGSYREAFFELLRARSVYPVEVQPWLDYLFAVLSAES